MSDTTTRKKLEPWDYQLEGVEKFEHWWTSPEMEALIALTMGMGKTITAACCVTRFLEKINPKGRILWLTHREELIEQSKLELEIYTGQYCEIEKASQRFTGLAQIIVASVQTLRGKRLQTLAEDFQPDLLIFDEAHHGIAPTWMQVKQTFPKAKVLNLTATPFRSDIGNRLELGTVLLEKNTTDGIRMGVLVPPKPIGKMEINLGTIKKRLGDYDVASLAELLCRDEIVKGCLELIDKNCRGHKSILFAASVDHGKLLAENLREIGFRVGEVYGTTPTEERKGYYDGVRDGTVDILVNNLCLDAKTEILTLNGWKTHQTISEDDLVANWENGKIWFAKPQKIIKRKRARDERMVMLDTRQKSIRVTEGHRMLQRRYKGRYIHTDSEQLIGKKWECPVSGQAPACDFPLPELGQLKGSAARRRAGQIFYMVHRDGIPRDEAHKSVDAKIKEQDERHRYRLASELNEWDCRFIGFWIGDGSSVHLHSGGIEHKLYQGDCWPNAVNWVHTLCQNLGVDYLHKRRSVKSSITPINVWSFPRGTGWGPQARKGLFYLEPFLAKGPNPLFWNLNEQQFDALLEGYWFADGNHGQKNKLPRWFELRGSRKELFDQLQAVAVCRGYKASLRPGSNTPGSHGNNQQDWILTLSKKGFVNVSKSHSMEWDQNGCEEETVWCVSTESTNIITRRSGFVTVMGNCLTEGFNLPALDIAIMLRPTRNAALYLQAIGRVLRKDPNNPAKTHGYIIDIIDTAKRRGGEECPLPTDDDVRVYSALQGRSACQTEVFLGWFYKAAELADLVAGVKKVNELTKLDNADRIYKLLAPPWMAQLDVNPAAAILGIIWTPEGDYKNLLKPFRIGSPDAFRLLLGRKGWIYLPHNKLPQTDDQLAEYEVGAAPADAESNYTLTTLISQDAQLRNFIMDLFDPNQSLKEQASKCYDRFPLGESGFEVAWFKVIHKVDARFYFIQWKEGDTNHILARTVDGKIYSFQQLGRNRLDHQPGLELRHSFIPDFVKGVAWANKSMSAKQAIHVAKILDVTVGDAQGMHISSLSASALMSNQWNKAHLKNIGKQLSEPGNLVPVEYMDDVVPLMQVDLEPTAIPVGLP